MKPQSAPSPDSSDLTGFDAVMRRLVHVPKSEIEAEERKYDAMRKRLREKSEARGRKAE